MRIFAGHQCIPVPIFLITVGVSDIHFLHRNLENLCESFSHGTRVTAINEKDVVRHGA